MSDLEVTLEQGQATCLRRTGNGVQTTLHASVLDATAAVWAAANEPASTASSDAYGLNTKSLGALLAALPIEGFQGPLALSSASAWLPTQNGAIVTPADPGNTPATNAKQAVIQRRVVCTAMLTGPQAVALFGESLGRETFGDEIRIGRDVTAMGRVLRFAFELVAGKHVLPGLAVAARNTVPRARWQPVLGASERATYEAIAAMLPPVVGALCATRLTSAPRYDARATLDAALAFFVDAA